MSKRLLIPILLAAASCSSPADDGTQTCPAGQAYNPVTGACVVPSDGDQNNPTTNNADNNGENNVVADAGDPPTPDLGEPPDMPAPRDQGQPDPPDMKVPDADMGPDPGQSVRFVAIGDQGTGSATQYAVAASIDQVCQDLGGCDFALLLGDNFYDTGVSSADDMLFMTMFDIPYGGHGFPYYAVLGNHDLGGDGLGIDLDQNKANYHLEYSIMNPNYVMPSRYYEFSQGPLHFVGLDTTKIFFGDDSNQRADVPQMIANAGTRWKIAFGHHPYYSNGPHGNAGEYEGLPFIPIANGEHVRSFMEDHICGKVDFYICGHDHSRQDLVPDCQGTQFIVSGAGAKTTDLEGNNATHFESDLEGFLLVEATNTTFLIRFYDENGVMNHERLVTR